MNAKEIELMERIACALEKISNTLEKDGIVVKR